MTELLFDPKTTPRLFHATSANLQGPLRGGGYDGVFWTARESTFAQTYIAAAGYKQSLSVNNDEIDRMVRPNKDCVLYQIARTIGPAAVDVAYDFRGHAMSWSAPAGFARLRDVVNHIENVLGYRNVSDNVYERRYDLLCSGIDHETGDKHIERADYKKSGILCIVDGFQDMRFKIMAHGDSDLTDLQYHAIDAFRQAQAAGYDGIVIDDFTKTENWGDVAHLSIGFFPAAIERLHIERIPATRFEFGPTAADLRQTDSPEYTAWSAAKAATAFIDSVDTEPSRKPGQRATV